MIDLDLKNPYAPDYHEAKAMIENVLGVKPWSKQREILKSVFRDARITLVQSCTGAGKTKFAGDIALAWLLQRPNRNVITTAPTMRQVSALLWKEIRMTIAQARRNGIDIGGQLSPKAPELMIDDGWFMLGFSSNNGVNFQGWHSQGGTLIVIDEAVGVSKETWEALHGTMTGDNDRMLALFNPTIASGEAFELCKQAQEPRVGEIIPIRKIKIAATDIPNVKLGRTVIPGLTTRAFVESAEKRWGVDSQLYRARVKGEFPDGDDMSLVPLGWMDASVARWTEQQDSMAQAQMAHAITQKEIGLDVARMGDDKSVLCKMHFGSTLIYCKRLEKRAKADTMEVAGWCKMAMEQEGYAIARIDADGLGAGVFDRLNELGMNVIELRGGMRASEPTRFVNARSEWLWQLREALRFDAAVPLALPDDADLIRHATTIRYSLASDGRIAVEPKDDYKKRTGNGSPDELDAVAYALARNAGNRNGVVSAWH